ncbi:hypothetical protein SD71_07635 [Cohnella kolymensis]|uniref:Ricin B lectin domain-containing protein n=1 Tax=Cohnella kolymensis TaxID=1590652 RepID=A0ABR5A742_9BACL|nr:hypothetical protein [Cohnella kolymensis]KIL36468.1 hypothetical protein SD71_07635 [Cohnella kolymensis]
MLRIRRLLLFCLMIIVALPSISVFAGPEEAGAGQASDSTGEFVRIKNQWKGTYLYETEGKVRYGFPAINDVSAQWQIEEHNGYKRIKNRATGHYLHMQNEIEPEHITDPAESTAVEEGWTSDRWTIQDAAGQPSYVNVTSVDYPGRLLNVQVQNGYAQVNNWAQPGWGSALWLLEPASEQEPVRLVNSWKGTALYEEAGTVKDGSPAVNDPASHWYIEEWNGNKRIKNRATGHYLHMQNVIAPERMTDPAESSVVEDSWTSAQWRIQDAAGNPGHVNIVSVDYPDRLLNVQLQNGFAQVNNWAQRAGAARYGNLLRLETRGLSV